MSTHSHSNCLIICNGEAPTRQLIHKEYREHNLLIAADGGAEYCFENGLTPDIVIGDMDSFIAKSDDLNMLKDEDQETNDLEKALKYAIENEYAYCTILGATGLRVDQTLKNLSVLKKFSGCFKRLIMKDSYGDIFLLPKAYQLNLPVNTTVSLFPLSGKATGIVLKGFRYPLEHETLQNGVRDGTSNVITASNASITYETGDLLIFIHKPQRTNI